MQIDDRTKSQILLAALERRYEAIDKIRDRVYAISIWTLGIFLAGSGLTVQGNILYEEGFFAPDEALYPPQWAEMGTKAAKGRFFMTTYLLLSLGALVLIAAIGLSGLLF